MGCSVLTASRSSRRRKRFSVVLVSSNLKPCTHSPAGVVATLSRKASWMSRDGGQGAVGGHDVAGAAAEHVNVGVNEAGQHRLAGQFNDPGARPD